MNSGIIGSRIALEDVTVRDHGDRGIDGYGWVRLRNSLVTGNKIGIVTDRYVLLVDSTVTGNSQFDVVATHGVHLRGSSTVGP